MPSHHYRDDPNRREQQYQPGNTNDVRVVVFGTGKGASGRGKRNSTALPEDEPSEEDDEDVEDIVSISCGLPGLAVLPWRIYIRSPAPMCNPRLAVFVSVADYIV